MLEQSHIIQQILLLSSPNPLCFVGVSFCIMYILYSRDSGGWWRMYCRMFSICLCTWYLAGYKPISRYKRRFGQLLFVTKTSWRTDSSMDSKALSSCSVTLYIVSAVYSMLVLMSVYDVSGVKHWFDGIIVHQWRESVSPVCGIFFVTKPYLWGGNDT